MKNLILLKQLRLRNFKYTRYKHTLLRNFKHTQYKTHKIKLHNLISTIDSVHKQ